MEQVAVLCCQCYQACWGPLSEPNQLSKVVVSSCMEVGVKLRKERIVEEDDCVLSVGVRRVEYVGGDGALRASDDVVG